MSDLFTLKQTFMELGEIVAVATVKQLNPSFDQVKYDEACRLAGSERWIKFHTKQGNLTRHRRGTAKNSPYYYSRFEITALMKAEKATASFTQPNT